MRKTRLVDLNPNWAVDTSQQVRRIRFDCPEGHEDCRHNIPFTPALNGQVQTSPQQNGAQWDRTGDTFETLTLSPSIRNVPPYRSRQEAIDAGCIPEFVTEKFLCAFHGFIINGQITFCDDSK